MTTQQPSRFHTALNGLFEGNQTTVAVRLECSSGTQLFPARRCHLPLPTNAEDRFRTTFRCLPGQQKPHQAIATRPATPFNPHSPTTVRAA
jgi:hypothetical protein